MLCISYNKNIKMFIGMYDHVHGTCIKYVKVIGKITKYRLPNII